MIYGQYAKNYGNMNRTILSESDAIIDYLIKEQNNYSNLLLNESYIDEEERLMMEAKYEVLQEAVIGAVIAAIVALIGVIIVLLSKISGTINNGTKKVAEKMKEKQQGKKEDDKNKNATVQRNNGTGPIIRPESDEHKAQREKEQQERKEREDKYKKDMADLETKAKKREEIENAIKDYKSIDDLSIQKRNPLQKLSQSEVEDIIKKVISEDKNFNGVSLVDFSFYINPNCMDELNRMVDDLSKSRDISNYIPKDSMMKIVEYLENEEKIDNELLFEFQKDHIDPKYKTTKEKLIWLYNSKRINNRTLLEWSINGFDSLKLLNDAQKLQKNAKSIQDKMTNKLRSLKSKLERLKKDYLYGRNGNTEEGEGEYEYTKYNNMSLAAKKVRNNEKFDDSWETDKNVEYYGKGEKGTTNIEKFKNHVLRVERTSLSHFQNFLQLWIQAEESRISNISTLIFKAPILIVSAYRRKLYDEYKTKYGEKFTSRVREPKEDN